MARGGRGGRGGGAAGAAGAGAAGAAGAAAEDPAARADPGVPGAPPEAVAAHLAAAGALRARLGHYLGATFHYGGEWYWGLDRLHHLERRLAELGARRDAGREPLFPADADPLAPIAVAAPAPIDFYFSLRSPYSAIAAPRVFELGRLTGAPVRLKYVLPMVMRGLPVPRAKRAYIAQDAAREAFERGIAFGRINDPVGRPTERGLALIPLAQRLGQGQAYVSSFMRGVWAEGLDAGGDAGLRRIAERAGLAWSDARAALADEAWRRDAERHRAELFALGLWGVPSFSVRDTSVWGQDRLWAVRDALCGGSAVAGSAS
ncbi:MAG: DsbA family protein [Burkholderiaceae bacterium]